MTLYYGDGTWIGIGKELAWGAPVARAAWSPAMPGTDLRATPDRRIVPHLISGGSPMNPQRSHVLQVAAGGKVVVLARYRGIGLLLEAMLGAKATTGAGPYTHTFTLGDPRVLPSYTLELIRGDSGLAEVLAGCKAQRWSLSFTAADYAQLSLDIMAKSSAGRAAAGTPTEGDDVPILGSHLGVFSWNGISGALRSLEIMGDNKLASRPAHGSLYTAEPQPTDLREITARLTLDVDDDYYEAYQDGDQADATISAAGTGNDAAVITLHNALVKSVSDPIQNHGIISQTVELQMFSDGTDHGISIALTNDDAAYDTN